MAKNSVVKLEKNLKTTKAFSYSKGEANLSFSLNVDTSHGMRLFRDCLVEALKDVEELIASMKN